MRARSSPRQGVSEAPDQLVAGGEVAVENFEQMVWEVAEPPTVGSWLLLRRVSMDPAKIEENTDFLRREVLPQIKAEPGFRAVRNMIDRQTGEGMVGTLWTDRAAIEAAIQAAEERRRRAVSMRRAGSGQRPFALGHVTAKAAALSCRVGSPRSGS